MRIILLVVLHCSGSDNPAHDSISVIRNWHLHNGWSDVGYQYFVRQSDGEIEVGRPESLIGAHVKGYNENSIGICLSGNKNFTEKQFRSTAKLLVDIKERYNLEDIDIVHHNELDKNGKTCPNFNWVKEIKKYMVEFEQ